MDLGISLLWMLFVAALLLWGVFGIIYAYHWTRWSMNQTVAAIAILTYGISGGILLFIMFSATIAISL